MNLESQIEAVLFFTGEPMSIKRLADIVGEPVEHIESALIRLKEQLEQRGVVLIESNDEVSLATAPGAAQIIEKFTKEELIRDLGKAGLETLSIILYKGPISRREIDYIRGVSSAFIVRNLLIRGLIERTADEDDGRTILYRPTINLLAHLGVQAIEDLPEYSSVKVELLDEDSHEI